MWTAIILALFAQIFLFVASRFTVSALVKGAVLLAAFAGFISFFALSNSAVIALSYDGPERIA